MRLRPDPRPTGIQHAHAPANGGAYGRAQDAQLGKRPEPEDQARIQTDVDGIGDPQRPHRRGGIARAAEDRVDQEQQEDRYAAREIMRV